MLNSFFRCHYLLLLLSILLSSPASASPQYFFLFIGDGMGANQRTLAEDFAACQKGAPLQPEYVPLRMNLFPVQAMMRVHAHDRYITDSAASATAIATGHKTDDSAVAMLPDRITPVKTIAELAHKAGFAVGMITSVPINHATPACFYSHNRSRDGYAIAKQIPLSGFEYFAGGALMRPTGKNKDQPTALEIIRQAGYSVVMDFESAALVPLSQKFLLINSVADSVSGFPYALDDHENKLSRALQIGIDRLEKNEKGFFMMIEGGKIDWAAHNNDTRTVIDEVLNFDEALQPAMDFAKEHPRETTIVVTSDHDTGGLALGWYGTRYASNFRVLLGQKFSAERIYKELTPLRVRQASFEEIQQSAQNFFGLTHLSFEEEKDLKEAWRQTLRPWKDRKDDPASRLKYGTFDPFVAECVRILAHRAGLSWTNWAHTASTVPVSALGEGAHIFNGVFDNTELFYKIRSLLKLNNEL